MTSHKALKKLHRSLIDAREGYDKAVREAEDPRMKDLFQRLQSHHQRSHAELHQLLKAAGETVDDDGSLMGTVNKTVVSIRSAVTGLDAASLSGFIDGEMRNMEKYDDAIMESNGDPASHGILNRQKQHLAAIVSEMKSWHRNAA